MQDQRKRAVDPEAEEEAVDESPGELEGETDDDKIRAQTMYYETVHQVKEHVRPSLSSSVLPPSATPLQVCAAVLLTFRCPHLLQASVPLQAAVHAGGHRDVVSSGSKIEWRDS